MKRFKRIWILSIVLAAMTGPALFAQQGNSANIAYQYYIRGQYDKAAVYYKKLYKQTRSPAYFDKYVSCLVNTDQREEAIKLLEKETKKNPGQLVWKVKLGQLYDETGQTKNATKIWDKVIGLLKDNPNQIVAVAKYFSTIGQTKYAIAAYEKGRQYINGFYTFNIQLADLYGSIGEYDRMIDLYLELIEINPAYLQTIQTLLNRNFDFSQRSPQTEIVKERLLRKVNQYPDNITYVEMLIWMYLQENNFAAALRQARALDKRFRENGYRVISLARLAVSNKDYHTAIEAYDYVISKGEDGAYYKWARVEKLLVKKDILDDNPHATKEQYRILAGEYRKTLEELGTDDFTAGALRNLASVEAIELDNAGSAINLLEQAIESGKLSKKQTALTKLDLGDYLLMTGRIWDASIYYMQVEKAFKYEPIGDIAKLKVARIAYYTGDFKWAEAQLNILKGSTSKLIANDALYLSNLISDNTGLDTAETAMQRYARADLLVVQKDYDKALALLDSIKTGFPGHTLDDDILMMEYRIYMDKGMYPEAAERLETLYTTYGYDILGDDALFRLAELYDRYLDDKEKAKELYLEFITTYDSSIYIEQARKRYRQLRGDKLEQ